MKFGKKVRKKDRALLDEIREHGCVVCGVAPSDPAHIRSVGAGGDDTLENVMPLCRLHHTRQHAIGWVVFAHEFEAVRRALARRGWVTRVVQKDFIEYSELVKDKATG